MPLSPTLVLPNADRSGYPPVNRNKICYAVFGRREPVIGRRSFQGCVFSTAASRAAPVREAVISVLARSRSRTR